jgi:hypothetical protein
VYDTCITTGLSALLANTLQVYPSPNSSGIVQIKGIPNNLQLSIEIVDVSGRILYQQHNIQNNIKIPIQSLAKGCYFFVFRNESEIFSKPFIRL